MEEQNKEVLSQSTHTVLGLIRTADANKLALLSGISPQTIYTIRRKPDDYIVKDKTKNAIQNVINNPSLIEKLFEGNRNNHFHLNKDVPRVEVIPISENNKRPPETKSHFKNRLVKLITSQLGIKYAFKDGDGEINEGYKLSRDGGTGDSFWISFPNNKSNYLKAIKFLKENKNHDFITHEHDYKIEIFYKTPEQIQEEKKNVNIHIDNLEKQVGRLITQVNRITDHLNFLISIPEDVRQKIAERQWEILYAADKSIVDNENPIIMDGKSIKPNPILKEEAIKLLLTEIEI